MGPKKGHQIRIFCVPLWVGGLGGYFIRSEKGGKKGDFLIVIGLFEFIYYFIYKSRVFYKIAVLMALYILFRGIFWSFPPILKQFCVLLFLFIYLLYILVYCFYIN